ncbi:hypothetical protein KUCAC02_025302 [Chaenocephalus aceratus]|uniref:Uncharacterized protein n=1 Tax=Chaenocephalus aceratus TaxID=36190 RepID=A0ACB9VU45_CHAAC|nr:hypothetical protein KUCAC02_025302 [Chaenocephalus aceratus]
MLSRKKSKKEASKPAEVHGKYVKKETSPLLRNLMPSFIRHGPTIPRRTEVPLPDMGPSSYPVAPAREPVVSRNKSFLRAPVQRPPHEVARRESHRMSAPPYLPRSLGDLPHEYGGSSQSFLTDVGLLSENGDAGRRGPERFPEDYRYYEHNEHNFQRLPQQHTPPAPGRPPSGIGASRPSLWGDLSNLTGTTGRSPPGWTVDWTIPRQNHPLEREGLPPGWEKVESAEFGVYYVDHINKRAQYRHPCAHSVPRYDQPPPLPPPVAYQPRPEERNQQVLVPANPLYARAPLKYDHILKWELFQLADLDTYQGMLKLLFMKELEHIVKSYEAYRQALLSELDARKQRQTWYQQKNYSGNM